MLPRSKTDRRFRWIVSTTILMMLIAGGIHYFATREPSPEPEPTVVTEETTAEDLNRYVEEKLEEQRQERLRDRLKDIGTESFKDGAREAKKSFLERFLWGDLDDEEADQ